jgi:hypothetical protein
MSGEESVAFEMDISPKAQNMLNGSAISMETLSMELNALSSAVFTKEGRHKQLLERVSNAIKNFTMNVSDEEAYQTLLQNIKEENLFKMDIRECISVLKKLYDINSKAEHIYKYLKASLDEANNEKKKRYTIVGSLVSFAIAMSVGLVASGSDRIGAYGLQVVFFHVFYGTFYSF